MIVAIEGLIPDPRARSSQKMSASPTAVPDPSEAGDPGPTPGPDFDSSEFISARPFSPAETTPSKPHAPVSAPAADTWRLRL
jgi:hypothetical protein